MTNPLNYIEKYPDRTKQIIGIDRQQWLSLLEITKDEEERLQLLREQTKIRINKKGGGRPKILNQDEEICLCIYYLRHLPTFEILGMQFGISKTEANDTFNYWLKIFRKTLPCSILEQSIKLSSNRQMGEESLTEYELIVDSWEQARERPGDNQIQKEYYSGKKKQHTFKGQVIGLPLGKDIVDVEVGKKGKASDINLFRNQQKKFEQNQQFAGDKGYQGGQNIKTPHKKPRNKELIQSKKDENKKSASNRIYVEHVIRLIKIFRAARERFSMNDQKYEQIILTICGLVRLRIGALILPTLS